jgi:hypothetical protein
MSRQYVIKCGSLFVGSGVDTTDINGARRFDTLAAASEHLHSTVRDCRIVEVREVKIEERWERVEDGEYRIGPDLRGGATWYPSHYKSGDGRYLIERHVPGAHTWEVVAE